MQIGEAILEALEKKQEALFGVVADWIEEFKRDHPENPVYLERLRSPNIRVRTIIDVVCKYGNRQERKLFARVNRIVLELRHKPDNIQYLEKRVGGLFSLEDRKALRRILNVGSGIRRRKKPILMSMKKRHAIHNDVWYMQAIKILLKKFYSAGGETYTSQ
jgi:hypothetical protein